MQSFDVVVIGGGPAGLSGALLLGRSMRRVLVIDAGRYRNERSRALHCFLGHDGIAPSQLLARAREQMARYPTITSMRAEVVSLPPGADRVGVGVRLAGGEEASARALLVATGVVDELPDKPGIEPLWGVSVHVCPYCDGWEHRDAPVAVLGKGDKGAGLAHMLRQWTSDLVLLTDGPHELPGSALDHLARRGISLEQQRIERLDGEDGELRTVVLTDGRWLTRRALFFSSGQHQRSPLLATAGCEIEADGGVRVDSEGRTSVPGIYAAGDVSRDVQLAIVAAAEGARAAEAIHRDLMERDGHLPA
jgi:thioredoxin reductase